ncbi:MAG: hypothetical protein H3C34_01135 [Caldilineaceae bacterium]|nr:hypothetical protein [Caldilineaceae bacterium]
MELPRAKVALLHNGQQPHEQVLRLLDRFGVEPIEVKFASAGELQADQFADCDLILFEAIDQFGNENQAALSWIRMGSRAPVVLLTSGMKADRTISGLLAGADAVISLSTSWDVIVAHCHALVRRWRLQKASTQQVQIVHAKH